MFLAHFERMLPTSCRPYCAILASYNSFKRLFPDTVRNYGGTIFIHWPFRRIRADLANLVRSSRINFLDHMEKHENPTWPKIDMCQHSTTSTTCEYLYQVMMLFRIPQSNNNTGPTCDRTSKNPQTPATGNIYSFRPAACWNENVLLQLATLWKGNEAVCWNHYGVLVC